MKANWLDKGIGWVSPSTGLRRVRARMALEGIQSLAYEGAKTSRRTEGWTTASGNSANAEIGSSLVLLRERSRSLFRDSPVKKALNVLVSNIVGTGIIPQPRNYRSDGEIDKDLNRKLTDFFDRWQSEADADDQLDFWGLQALIVRTVIESGECLIRFRNRRPQDGMETIPLQLQVLEPDFLDLSKNQATTTGYILQGKEFDKLGSCVAYWLFPQHPGESLPGLRSGSLQSRRIPASEILHIYVKERPQQIRGVPWLAPVMLTIRDRDDWIDAKILQKKIQSCLVGFVTQLPGEEEPLLKVGTGSSGIDTSGNSIEFMEPGMIQKGKPGEDIKFNTPPSGDADTEFLKSINRDIASFGVTYQQLTGDLSDANFSNYKAGHIDFKGMVEGFRYLTMMPMCLIPIWRKFIDYSVLSGEIEQPVYRVNWMPPAFGTVDEARDRKADQISIRSGTQTWGQAVAARGYDPDEQLEEIAEWNKKMDALGITLDSDPRKGKGTTEAQAEGEDNDAQNKKAAA